MFDFSSIGRMIVTMGVILIIVGIAISFGAKLGLGRLPGDIAIKKGNFAFYFPIVTMLIISVVLTILLNLIRRLF